MYTACADQPWQLLYSLSSDRYVTQTQTHTDDYGKQVMHTIAWVDCSLSLQYHLKHWLYLHGFLHVPGVTRRESTHHYDNFLAGMSGCITAETAQQTQTGTGLLLTMTKNCSASVELHGSVLHTYIFYREYIILKPLHCGKNCYNWKKLHNSIETKHCMPPNNPVTSKHLFNSH